MMIYQAIFMMIINKMVKKKYKNKKTKKNQITMRMEKINKRIMLIKRRNIMATLKMEKTMMKKQSLVKNINPREEKEEVKDV